jgi:hypothetical protein
MADERDDGGLGWNHLYDPNWSVTHIGDFDGGSRRPVWRNSATGATAIWLMSGAT